MQYVNGHLIIYYPSSDMWLVDSRKACYTLTELAFAVGLSYDALCEVLTIF